MKKQMIAVLSVMAGIASTLAAQRKALPTEAIAKYFDPAFFGEPWKAGRSSALIEKNKPVTEYEITKIEDHDLATAWAEGAVGAGIGEYASVQIFCKDKIVANTEFKLQLRINNGFCKSEKLFKVNNRVKKALITIYAVPVKTTDPGARVLDPGAVIIHEFEIDIADKREPQQFESKIKLLQDFSHAEGTRLFLQLTILDVYRGEKYDDTCISELSATAEQGRE